MPFRVIQDRVDPDGEEARQMREDARRSRERAIFEADERRRKEAYPGRSFAASQRFEGSIRGGAGGATTVDLQPSRSNASQTMAPDSRNLLLMEGYKKDTLAVATKGIPSEHPQSTSSHTMRQGESFAEVSHQKLKASNDKKAKTDDEDDLPPSAASEVSGTGFGFESDLLSSEIYRRHSSTAIHQALHHYDDVQSSSPETIGSLYDRRDYAFYHEQSMKNHPSTAYSSAFLESSDENPQKYYEIGLAFYDGHVAIILQDITGTHADMSTSDFEYLGILQNKPKSPDENNLRQLEVVRVLDGERDYRAVSFKDLLPHEAHVAHRYHSFCRLRTTDRMIKYVALTALPQDQRQLSSDGFLFPHQFLVQILNRLRADDTMSMQFYKKMILDLVRAGSEVNSDDGQTIVHETADARLHESIRQLFRVAWAAFVNFHQLHRYTSVGFQRQEPSLTNGRTRIRWQCLCKRRFFSDVEETSRSSAEQLEDALNYHDRKVTETETSETPVSSSISRPRQCVNSLPATVSSLSPKVDSTINQQVQEGTGSDSTADNASATSGPSDEKTDSSDPFDVNCVETDDQRNTETRQGSETVRKYMYPCFKCSRYGIKAKPLDISSIQYDAELVTSWRAEYFAERSYLRRFFELREVKEIYYIHFDLTAVDLASVRKRDVWPKENDKDYERWEYHPRPASDLPLVPSNHLMHLWHYPHHVDKDVYDAWQKRTSRVKQWLEWIRISVARMREPSSPAATTSTRDQSSDPDRPIPPRKKTFVFKRTPKRVGDPLEPDYGDEDPEGWGVLFEEGFQVHRLLLAILGFYFLGSVAFMVTMLVKFESTFPTTWPALIAFWSWLTTFLSLAVTVWFKWAD